MVFQVAGFDIRGTGQAKISPYPQTLIHATLSRFRWSTGTEHWSTALKRN